VLALHIRLLNAFPIYFCHDMNIASGVATEQYALQIGPRIGYNIFVSQALLVALRIVKTTSTFSWPASAVHTGITVNSVQ
jgi:hypothetical protein